ncbi:MAG: hypothetical protein V3T65_02240, partial [Acidobacteriota bacterium]
MREIQNADAAGSHVGSNRNAIQLGVHGPWAELLLEDATGLGHPGKLFRAALFHSWFAPMWPGR